MNETRYSVNLIAADGSITPGEFLILTEPSHELDRVQLTLILPDQRYEATSIDGFEALILIRLELEPLGLMPLCWGASLHVYPSDASRRDGIGDQAYRLTLGKFPSTTDQVNIFDSGPGLVVASVADQEEFSRAWFDSLASS